MCGIYGAMEFERRGAPLGELLTQMASVIEHRGPDDAGQFVGPGIGLGMRRLSIIDLEGGHQPICNEDETIWLVMNGEIYNYQKLRVDLERKGHRFRTNSDTEVIVHLYEDEGPAFFKFLRGMFGLALWDGKRQRLVLGRDRIGEKPLYFRKESNRLLFASEMKSILQVDDVARRINLGALEEYLALGYVPAPLTLLEGIEKLLPGYFLLAEKGQTSLHKYWDVIVGQFDKCSEAEWIERLREKLLDSIQSQLVSDVPLGAFLSGGIDSSAIVAVMSHVTGHAVKTYSIGYGGDASYYNELPYAKLVAQAFATEHHEIIVQPQVSELLPQLVWHLDEPIADSACLTTYLVSRLARQSVKVILSGVGGDELFGGYRRYLGDSIQNWYRLLPGPVRRTLLPALLRRLPQDRVSPWKDYVRYAAAFAKSVDEDSAVRYMSYVTLLSPQAQADLLTADSKRASNESGSVSEALRRYFSECNGSDPLSRAIFVDLKTSLPDDLLALTDRMSMAASIECRAPLVDFELVELACRIPSHFKVRGLKMKYLLKKAVAPWLPRQIIERKKRGFGAPVGGWLRKELQPLLNELLSEQQVRRRGLFQWPAIRELISAHEAQRSDHTDHLFALIALEFWCRAYLDGASNATTNDPSLVNQNNRIVLEGLKSSQVEEWYPNR